MDRSQAVRALMEWHALAGVDETLGALPVDRFALTAEAATAAQPVLSDSQAQPAFARGEVPPPPVVTPALATPPMGGEESVRTATELAGSAKSVDDLREALEAFDGCALKKTATNLVFTEGESDARIMLVGEAPGAEEDRQGLPFVGPSGTLLNKMLGSIGVSREEVLISNTVFWRPPGNRTPTPQEAAICMPFMQRLIELVRPDVLVPMGGPAAKSLLQEKLGIGKLRGRWFEYRAPGLTTPIAATPLFHPAYLLRTPGQKRAAWRDLLMIKQKLDAATSN